LHEDLSTYSKIFEEFGLNISFKIEDNQLNKSDDGFLELYKNNQLKLKLGPKYFFSNLKDMRIFDIRTNQIMIQNPDSLVFIYLKNFFKNNNIDSLKINTFVKDTYLLEYKSLKLEIIKNSSSYFSKINFGDYELNIKDILIDTLKTENEIFNIDTSSSFIIDLRK